MSTINGKVYLARFTNRETREIEFYKFGHTHSYDAMDRFTYAPEQYAKWDIKIIKTVYGPLEQMKGIEETFKALYPKNLWIEEKVSGVTEIVKLEQPAIDRIIGTMTQLNGVYWRQREREKAQGIIDYLKELDEEDSPRSPD